MNHRIWMLFALAWMGLGQAGFSQFGTGDGPVAENRNQNSVTKQADDEFDYATGMASVVKFIYRAQRHGVNIADNSATAIVIGQSVEMHGNSNLRIVDLAVPSSVFQLIEKQASTSQIESEVEIQSIPFISAICPPIKVDSDSTKKRNAFRAMVDSGGDAYRLEFRLKYTMHSAFTPHDPELAFIELAADLSQDMIPVSLVKWNRDQLAAKDLPKFLVSIRDPLHPSISPFKEGEPKSESEGVVVNDLGCQGIFLDTGKLVSMDEIFKKYFEFKDSEARSFSDPFVDASTDDPFGDASDRDPFGTNPTKSKPVDRMIVESVKAYHAAKSKESKERVVTALQAALEVEFDELHSQKQAEIEALRKRLDTLQAEGAARLKSRNAVIKERLDALLKGKDRKPTSDEDPFR